MIEDQYNLTQYYRWQFLRLNEGYRCSYDKSSKFMREAKFNSEAEKKEHENNIILDLKSEYGINGLYNYDSKELPEGLLINGNADFIVKKGSLKSIWEGEESDEHLVLANEYGEIKNTAMLGENWAVETIFVPKFIEIVINTSAKDSEILEEIKKIITAVRRQREKREKKLAIESTLNPDYLPQARSETYDQYALLYELIRYNRFRLIDAAIKVYKVKKKYKFNGQQFRNDFLLQKTEKKASAAYKEAIYLVEKGGYRNIYFKPS